MLQAHGHQAVVTDRFGQDPKTGLIYPMVGDWDDKHRFTGTIIDAPDVVVFVRWMREEMYTVTRKAQAAGQKVVQDIDDWLWGIPPSNAGSRALAGHLQPKHWTERHNVNDRRAFSLACGAADLITCSTDPLRRRLQDRYPDVPVQVLANMIDLEAYSPQPPSGPAKTVGWVGHTGYRARDLEILRGILDPFCRRHGLTFVHGGHQDGAPLAGELAGLSDDVDEDLRDLCAPWEYPSLFPGIDIGLAPLTDNPFNECKSDTKALEYAAAGIPFVASEVGPYLAWKDLGRTASKPRHWFWHLEQLINPEDRARTAMLQAERAAEHDIQDRWVDWLTAYEALLA
jgi:hypothetical protein